jgi:hypothetical protein
MPICKNSKTRLHGAREPKRHTQLIFLFNYSIAQLRNHWKAVIHIPNQDMNTNKALPKLIYATGNQVLHHQWHQLKDMTRKFFIFSGVQETKRNE